MISKQESFPSLHSHRLINRDNNMNIKNELNQTNLKINKSINKSNITNKSMNHKLNVNLNETQKIEEDKRIDSLNKLLQERNHQYENLIQTKDLELDNLRSSLDKLHKFLSTLQDSNILELNTTNSNINNNTNNSFKNNSTNNSKNNTKNNNIKNNNINYFSLLQDKEKDMKQLQQKYDNLLDTSGSSQKIFDKLEESSQFLQKLRINSLNYNKANEK